MKSFRKTSIPIVALGAMSGTSLDGVDAAVLVTDGHDITVFGPTQYRRRTDSAFGALGTVLGQRLRRNICDRRGPCRGVG